jgi:uncharacterized protein (DUF433 family)
MDLQTTTQWKFLAPKAGSAYRQLFVNGTRIMARVLYGLYANKDEPMTPEEIAAAYELPVEAVAEAIAYCQSNPPEIREDWEREEASIQEMVRRNPGYVHPMMTNPPTA